MDGTVGSVCLRFRSGISATVTPASVRTGVKFVFSESVLNSGLDTRE